MRFKSADFDKDSNAYRQIARAEKQIEEDVAKREDAIGSSVRSMSREEQALQMEMIRAAREWPMGLLVDQSWPMRVRGTALIEFLFHVPNGGYRSRVEAAIFKGMGVKAGVFDLFCMLPVVRDGRVIPGLWIENKASENAKLTPAQEAFGNLARFIGYDTAECRSSFEFQAEIERYFKGSRPTMGSF